MDGLIFIIFFLGGVSGMIALAYYLTLLDRNAWKFLAASIVFNGAGILLTAIKYMVQ